jgi:integrase
MASVERRVRDGKATWRAHWRDPDGRQRNRSFNRKVDATRFLTGIEQSKNLGSYIDPGRALVTVGTVADQWIAGKINLKPTTRARYESALTVHVRPRWGSVPLAKVGHGDIQAWLAQLAAAGQSGASIRKSHGVLLGILTLAVKDRRIPSNPALGVDLVPLRERPRRYLTAGQVEQLAVAASTLPKDRPKRSTDAAFAQYRLVVLVLAYCGLRWSEVAGLRVGRVDLLRRRLDVAEAVTEVNGTALAWGTPKTHEARSVPLPRFLIDDLAVHMAGRAPGDLVFTAPDGGGTGTLAARGSTGRRLRSVSRA